MSDSRGLLTRALDLGRADPELDPPPIYRRRHLQQIALFAVVVAIAPQATSSAYGYGLLQSWATMSLVGLGFYVAFALGGQFAFSQAAFMGLGAYSSAYLSDRYPVELGYVGAALIAAAVAAAFALLVRKAHHFFFAIGTLALSELIMIGARNWTNLTGPAGEVLGIARPELLGTRFIDGDKVFYLLAGTLVVGLVLVSCIERSPLRRDAIANRDKGALALLVGGPVLRTRVSMFVIGSAFAGVGGSLFAHTQGFAIPEAFGVNLGIEIFLIVLVGGLGSMWGSVFGAAFVIWLREALRDAVQFRDVVFGLLLVVLMIGAPDGIVGAPARVRSLWTRLWNRSDASATATAETAA